MSDLVVAGVRLANARSIGGGDICSALHAELDGRAVFAKTLPGAPADFFAAEARGLDFIRCTSGPRVPLVIAVADDGIVLEWIAPGTPSGDAAVAFGRALARLHARDASTYGAAAGGFIGALPLDNTPGDEWPTFYAERRLAPYLATLAGDDRRDVERLCERINEVAGPAERPAPIHGDLWSGNVVWAADGNGWLVDAASAHGGHRETDLAMLALFGAPHLDRILAGYEEVAPLAEGWRDRVPLHQLHPLLVHAVMFGGGYASRAAAAARRMLALT